MTWSVETDPDFQTQLDWVDAFVSGHVEPLDLILDDPYDNRDAFANSVVAPLQDQVRSRGLWECLLGPELGGQGFGQLKLTLLNQILGRSRCAPSVFGCQASDSGNARILAHDGSAAQKQADLQPLLDGTISSCYSMTEPLADADSTLFNARPDVGTERSCERNHVRRLTHRHLRLLGRRSVRGDGPGVDPAAAWRQRQRYRLTALHLWSDASSYTTGAVIKVDGGWAWSPA